MLERDMPEIPSSPGIGRETRTVEIRERTDPRTDTIGAFNRTLDRMQLERDAILARAHAEGPGFLNDRDRMIVLGYQYAAEGAKQLTGGNERLNDDVENDKIPVEVADRATEHKYIRNEGIAIGCMVKYLKSEEKRLNGIAEQASKDGRYEDANNLRNEAHNLWFDHMRLIGNSGVTSIAVGGDFFLPDMSKEVQRASLGSGGMTRYFQENRIGTEAYLRSKNELIKELGGESQDENWVKAEEDILNDRYELHIPDKGSAYPDFSVGSLSKSDAPPTTSSGGSIIGFEKEEIPPTRVTALARVEPEEEGVIPVLVSGGPSGETDTSPFTEDPDAGRGISSTRVIPPWAGTDRGGRGPRVGRYGELIPPEDTKSGSEASKSSEGAIIEGAARVITDADKRREERDDPLRDLADKIKGTKWGGVLKSRVKGFVGGLPKPGLRRSLLAAGNIIGAAGLIVGGKMLYDQVRSGTPEYDYGRLGAPHGEDVGSLPRGGRSGTIEPNSIPFAIDSSGAVVVNSTPAPSISEATSDTKPERASSLPEMKPKSDIEIVKPTITATPESGGLKGKGPDTFMAEYKSTNPPHDVEGLTLDILAQTLNDKYRQQAKESRKNGKDTDPANPGLNGTLSAFEELLKKDFGEERGKKVYEGVKAKLTQRMKEQLRYNYDEKGIVIDALDPDDDNKIVTSRFRAWDMNPYDISYAIEEEVNQGNSDPSSWKRIGVDELKIDLGEKGDLKT